MPELSKEAHVYNVSYICDECGKGEMRPTGEMLASHPPQFPHKCNNCGAKNVFGRQYPQITYGMKE